MGGLIGIIFAGRRRNQVGGYGLVRDTSPPQREMRVVRIISINPLVRFLYSGMIR
jgi:hypothetical protein